MIFNIDESIKQFTNRVKKESHTGIYKVDLIDAEGVKFANKTPMSYLIDKEFILRTNNKNYHSILNF